MREAIFADYVNNLTNTKNKLKLNSKNINFQPRQIYGTVGDLKFMERMIPRIVKQFPKEDILRLLPKDYAETFFKCLDAVNLGIVIQNINDCSGFRRTFPSQDHAHPHK